MFEWILWRHAEAGFGHSDLARPLTAQGQQQAADSAQWLKQQGVDFPVYCSEAVRGQQTAGHYHNTVKTLAGLNPGNSIAEVRNTLQTLKDKNAVIVGHLPWINYIVQELIDSPIPTYHYSSLCWLQHEHEQWTLKAQYRF